MAVYSSGPTIILDDLVSQLDAQIRLSIKEPNDKELQDRIKRTKELIIQCLLVNKDQHTMLRKIYF